MSKLRGKYESELVKNEIEQLEIESQMLKNENEVEWLDFFRKSYLRRPIIVAIIIHLSQQLSGINAVLFNFFVD